MSYNKARCVQQMEKNVEFFIKELSGLRSGKANASLLNNLVVELWGSKLKFPEVCSVSVIDNLTLSVKPYDAGSVTAVEKAIKEANLGVSLIREGNIMRVKIPPMNEQTRKDLVKVAQRTAESSRVSVRNTRRDVIEIIAKSEKGKEISQDDARRFKEEVEKITKDHIDKIDKILNEKEKELMTL